MNKLMIVEDDYDMQLLAILFFKKHGYETLGVASKSEFCEQLHYFNPDMILMDIMLGNDDGRDICRELKKTHKHIKVILVSAREDLTAAFIDCDADFSFIKPYDLTTIGEKFTELIA